MRAKTYLVFELLMAAALVGLNVAYFCDFSTGAILFKAVASVFFVLAGFCGYRKDKANRDFSRLMLIGFICCMAGDILLALDDSGILFVLGVVSFAAAHVLFSVAFCRRRAVTKTDIAAMVVLFAGLLLVLCLGKSLGKFDFKGLFPVLAGYAAIISFMVIKALSLRHCSREEVPGAKLIIPGGVFFLLSDALLLFCLFGIGIETGVVQVIQSINWVLYYLAQGCLTAALNR